MGKCNKCTKPIKPEYYSHTRKLCYKCWQASKIKTRKILHDANQRIRINN